MAFRITGIRKPGGADNPHEAISAYRWIDDGKTVAHIDMRPMVVGWVDKGIPAYVLDGAGNRAYCKVNVSRSGTRFLQTFADGKWTDNLLALPEC